MTNPIKDKEPSTAHAFVRAAASGDLATVRSLLSSGADVNGPNEEGQTALILAAVMGHAEVVAHLISAGADPHMRDRLNLTALEWSTRRGFFEVTQLLAQISPPLQPFQAESKEEQTEGEGQTSELPTREQAPANQETVVSAETAAATTEQESSEAPGTLAPPPQLVESSTSEDLSEPAAVATESAASLPPSVLQAPALVANEPESSPATAELEGATSPIAEESPELSSAVVNAAPSALDETPSLVTEESPKVSAAVVSAAPSESEETPSLITEESPKVSAAAVSAAPSESEVPPSLITEESPKVSAASVSAAPSESEVPPASTTETPSEVSATSVDAATTELEVPPPASPLIEASPEVSAATVSAATTELEAPPSSATEPTPEESASVVNAATTELEVPPLPTTEGSAVAVNAETTEVEVPPSPTTVESPEAPASAVYATPEVEAPKPPAAEAAPEVSGLAVSATPTSDLQSWDPDYDAEREFSTERVHPPQGDDTLPHPRVPASTVDIRFPELPSATASAETREAPPPAVQTSFPENRPAPFSGTKPRLSTSAEMDVSNSAPNMKRCPRCGAVYQNSPLSFCTRDNATLIGIDQFHPYVAPTQTQTSSTPIVVWLLIAFVLGASGFVAYRLTERFYSQTEPTPAAVKPVEAPAEVKKPPFTVGGNLAGRELSIPEPDYPSDLKAAGTSGSITVRVRVNKSGRVISASSSGGDSRLRSAAVKAARQATFAPDKIAEISTRGRAVTGTITYEFAAPQPTAATSTATTSATAASGPSPVPSPSPANSDPNAPVVSNELVGAASNVPAADYPSRVREARIGGSITVTVRVNRNGRVVSWRSSPGDSQLRAAAIKAARKATFAREKLPTGGEVVGTITYNFVP